jgi:hypothetical protein
VVGTAEQLPWPAAAFDLVVSTTSGGHLSWSLPPARSPNLRATRIGIGTPNRTYSQPPTGHVEDSCTTRSAWPGTWDQASTSSPTGGICKPPEPGIRRWVVRHSRFVVC